MQGTFFFLNNEFIFFNYVAINRFTNNSIKCLRNCTCCCLSRTPAFYAQCVHFSPIIEKINSVLDFG